MNVCPHVARRLRGFAGSGSKPGDHRLVEDWMPSA